MGYFFYGAGYFFIYEAGPFFLLRGGRFFAPRGPRPGGEADLAVWRFKDGGLTVFSKIRPKMGPNLYFYSFNHNLFAFI